MLASRNRSPQDGQEAGCSPNGRADARSEAALPDENRWWKLAHECANVVLGGHSLSQIQKRSGSLASFGRERIGQQRGLARSGHPGDDGHGIQGETDVDVLEVVGVGTDYVNR